MREHWSSGYADVLQTLRHPAWRGREPGDGSVRVLDLLERDRECDACAKSIGHALLNGSPMLMFPAKE